MVRILLVEDDPVEAIKALAIERPDAVVLDLGLRDLDGSDVCPWCGRPARYRS